MAANSDPRRLFDARGLEAAVDAQRRARSLTWSDLAARLGVAASSMRGLDQRSNLESDTVLQMTRWLGRTVESFCPDLAGPHAAAAGDRASTGTVLRRDAKALHAALDTQRKAQGLTWDEAARAIWSGGPVSGRTLQQMRNGGRVNLYVLLACARWLGQPVSAFTRISEV